MSEREYKALRGVPASTWMEGFCVTKQMEKACMCLMSGEVSVTAQSQTVSRAHRFPLSVASCQHGKRDSIGTVSYTHLDVYKRQQKEYCRNRPLYFFFHFCRSCLDHVVGSLR